MAQTTLPEDQRRRLAESLSEKVANFIFEVPYITSEKFEEICLASSSQSDRNLLVIDAREPEEIATGSIANAIPISEAAPALDELEKGGGALPVNIVCYCTVGLRSGIYARQLLGERRQVYNYSIMVHLWSDGSLVRPDGSEWQGEVHSFTSRYDQFMPSKFKYVGFGVCASIVKSLSSIPGLLYAAVAWAGRPAQPRETPQDPS